MRPVSGDEDIVARTKLALSFALDAQTRRAGEEKDPLGVALPMRLVRRRGLASGNNPFDAHAIAR